MKIIVALDYTNPLEALEMCAKLRDVADGFKINHALWSQSVYIKDYTKAIKINNKELFGYINRGYLLIKKNKINQGCSDYKKALALNENLSRKYIQNEELINCKISI